MRLSNKEIERLFRSHHKALNGLARKSARTDEAEDIVQDAYLRLLEMEDTAHVCNTRSYLFRVVSNMAIDWLRKQQAHAGYFADVDKLDGPYAVDLANGGGPGERAFLDGVRIRIAELPQRRREIFLLSRIQQFSQLEIANRLGVSVRTVSRDLSEATSYLLTNSEPRRTQGDRGARFAKSRRHAASKPASGSGLPGVSPP